MGKTNRHLTILHSNDLHASFVANEKQDTIIGGFPYLLSYINYNRQRNPKKLLYLVAGDLFSGNLIDFDSKGVNSIKLFNELHPDATCIGNHSVDHKLARLTVLEHLCECPILCSNIYVKGMDRTFFKPYEIIKKNGINILVIGIVTEELMNRVGKDPQIEEFFEYKDPIDSIYRVFDKIDKKTMEKIDLKIILSHMGCAKDKEIANTLDRKYGIDMIIGGHSHTYMKQAYESENGIIVVQAGKTSSQIGHFEITVDTENHRMISWEWCLKSIESGHGFEPDKYLNMKVGRLHKEMLEKYAEELIEFKEELRKDIGKAKEDDFRYEENVVGDFFCDLLKEMYNANEDKDKQVDVCLIGSGSLRTQSLGKIMTRYLLREMYSVNDVTFRITLTGDQLKKAMAYVLQKAPLSHTQDGEYYQVDKDCKFVYDYAKDENGRVKGLTVAWACGAEIDDKKEYKVAIEDYHYYNIKKFLNISEEEVKDSRITLSSDTNTDIEEYLRKHKDFEPVYELQGRTLRMNCNIDRG